MAYRNDRIYRAMENNDIALVAQLISQEDKSKLTEKDAFDRLNGAVFLNSLPLVQLTLPNILQHLIASRNYTTLSDAIFYKHIEIALYLIKECVPINGDFDKDNPSPLKRAVENGMDSMIDLLLELGADPSQENILHMAAEKDNVELAQKLLNHNVNIDRFDLNDHSALMVAAANGSTNVFKLLLDNGANPNVKDEYEYGYDTALEYAVEHGYTDIVDLVLQSGRATQENMHLALYTAVYNNNIDVVQRLLNADGMGLKSAIGELIYGGDTPLHWAVRNPIIDPNMIYMLIGENVNDKNDGGQTPLMSAVQAGNLEAVKILLQFADPNIEDEDGDTALLEAIKIVTKFRRILNVDPNTQKEIIPLLINAGADVNKQDYEGMSPLMLATQHSDDWLIDMLLAAGADVNLRTADGRQAKDF